MVLSLYGLFSAFTDGVGKAWISTLVPAKHQPGAQGTSQGLIGLGVLIAGIWAGLAWGGDGHLPLIASRVTGAVIAAFLLTTTTQRAGNPRILPAG